ncbi:hypothetical protein GCM10010116_61730 [Microbispora rosea subsp. aerata]|nr:hypothetical protein GCM10010116_61730 [Microbispora rosea subsp. aerata]GIH59163.1 hypothetical protein Mro02_60770 [Microbispora rosea subsp. aerata]GLJ86930.1 hypothetical protein GCM10017588_56730 [Microbispora rosea subsp. aerata]
MTDDTILTHHTFKPTFLNAPRIDLEREVSLLKGKWTVEEASRYRRKILSDRDLRQADVRFTTAGILRSKGFAVVHTPGKIAGGPHVSVVWPPHDPLNRQDVPWPPDVVESFAQCFNGYKGNVR